MRRAATVLAAAAVALAACGGDDEGDRTQASTATAPETTSTAKTQTEAKTETERARPKRQTRKRAKALPAPEPTPNSSQPLSDGPGPGSEPAYRRADLDSPGTDRGRAVGRSRTSRRDRRAVLRVMRTFLKSLGSGDTVQACAQLTRAGKRRLERRIWKVAPETDTLPCEAALPVYRSAYGKALAAPRFKKVRVKRRRASAVGPGSEPFKLVKRKRTWKIDRFGSR